MHKRSASALYSDETAGGDEKRQATEFLLMRDVLPYLPEMLCAILDEEPRDVVWQWRTGSVELHDLELSHDHSGCLGTGLAKNTFAGDLRKLELGILRGVHHGAGSLRQCPDGTVDIYADSKKDCTMYSTCWHYNGIRPIMYPSTFVLTTLRVLCFNYTSLAKLPEDALTELPCLSSLTINERAPHSRLTLFETVSHLTALRSLAIDGSLLDQSVFWCTTLTALTSLSLHDCGSGIVSVPASIGALANLDCLELQNCDIREVPSQLSGCTRLVRLNLSCNALSHLPWQICVGCTRLSYIDLSNNRLTTLPPEIGIPLARKTELCIHQNQFVSLPAQVALRPPVLVERNKFRLSVTRTLIAFSTDGPLHTSWPPDTYLVALPRELQLVIHEYAAAPFINLDQAWSP